MDKKQFYKQINGAQRTGLVQVLAALKDWDLDVAAQEPVFWFSESDEPISPTMFDLFVRGESYDLAMAISQIERKYGCIAVRYTDHDEKGKVFANYIIENKGATVHITYDRIGVEHGWTRVGNERHINLFATPCPSEVLIYDLDESNNLPITVSKKGMDVYKREDSGLHILVDLDADNPNKLLATLGIKKKTQGMQEFDEVPVSLSLWQTVKLVFSF